jgi:hypothetical protein
MVKYIDINITKLVLFILFHSKSIILMVMVAIPNTFKSLRNWHKGTKYDMRFKISLI